MKLDRGLVFNQLINLLFYKTNWFKSFSDVVIATARNASREPQKITPDLQLFKKIRGDSADDIDYFFKLLYKYAPELESEFVPPNALEIPDDAGGWWLISKIVEQSTRDPERAVDEFWEKLSELCEDERRLINHTSREQHVREIGRLGEKWLDLKDVSAAQDGSCYVVRMVLIWLGIYEHTLRYVTHRLDEINPEPAYFSKLLPKCENGKLTLSNAQFCIAFKEKRLPGTSKSWNEFYTRIADAQNVSSTEKVKKAIEQIRSGKRNLLWTTYRDNFRILVPEFHGKAIHETEVIVLFCQLMTKIQLELIERGLTGNEIEELFSFYPTAYEKFSA